MFKIFKKWKRQYLAVGDCWKLKLKTVLVFGHVYNL